MASTQAVSRPQGAARVPVKRRTNGAANIDGIVNARPDMKYVLAAAGTTGLVGGVDYYQNLGYKVVLKEKDGADMVAGHSQRPIGAEVTNMGLVLMQIPKEDWLSIEQYGANGDTGQEYNDLIESRIRDTKHIIREVTEGARMSGADGTPYFSLTQDKE